MSDHGTTKSLYAKDPDGLEFEVVWLIPAHLLTGDEGDDIRPKPLDLAEGEGPVRRQHPWRYRDLHPGGRHGLTD